MAATLAERIHSLPRELYDEILDLIFTPSCQQTVHITKTYQPPNLLTVGRDTRCRFAAQYYGNTHFYCSDKRLLIIWLLGIPKAYQPLLTHVTLGLNDHGRTEVIWVKDDALWEVEDMMDGLNDNSFEHGGEGWLKVEVKGWGRWVVKDPGVPYVVKWVSWVSGE